MGNKKPDHWYEQSGVVPFRRLGGRLEVLLITSLKKGNWIVPKGIVEESFSPSESALKEALEEAGVIGRTVGDALGIYELDKWGGTCRVQLFAMRVDKQLEHWPEENVRERQWMPLHDAVRAVANREVGELIARLEDMVESDPG